MVTIASKYEICDLNLSSNNDVTSFNQQLISDICLDYMFCYGVYENGCLVAVVSYNKTTPAVINITVGSYDYSAEFYLVIEYFKNDFVDDNILNIEIKTNSNKLESHICQAGFSFKNGKYICDNYTLVFNGSPKVGISKQICDMLLEKYQNIKVIDAYKHNVKACTDCGYCSRHVCKCVFKDMDDIYKLVADASNIIFVSPVHVASVSAPLLAMFSRMQIYFANKFVHKNDFPFSRKQGFAIAVSGKNWPGQKAGVEVIYKHAFLEMNANFNYYCYLTNSDDIKDFDGQLSEFYKEIDKYVK